MKYLLLMLSLNFILSCSPPDDEDCSCNKIVGQRFYINVTKDFFSDCQYVDEMEYLPDGFVNLYRISKDQSGLIETKMSKALKYEILENCVVRFHSVDKSKILPETQCSFTLTVLNSLENKTEVKIPFTVLTCTSYNIGAVTHLNFNPR